MAAKINMRLDKNEMPSQDPNVRNKNFLEVALGYTEEQALDEAARCLNCKNHPCVNGCPVNVRIPEFIAKIVERDYEGAYQVIHQTSSLPAVCGRVCPQESQCEMHCVRGKKGDPVGIGRLERFVADWHNAHSTEAPAKPAPNGHKVAVVGSGPAGLTCASDLAKMGYEVSLFEAFHVAGGVLVYGIPEFRLPKAIVQKEVDGLKAMGVKVETNTVVGRTITIDELMEEYGFEAVFIGSGAGLPMFMNIPGENLKGVYSANEFLTRINLMKAYREGSDTPIMDLKGKTVAVVTGRKGDRSVKAPELPQLAGYTAAWPAFTPTGRDMTITAVYRQNLVSGGRVTKSGTYFVPWLASGEITIAGGLDVTLHRAFDMTRDPIRTMEDAIRLGCRTILTSGQQKDALTGVELLRQLQETAAGRIDIMAGCGVKRWNIQEIHDRAGITVFHTTGRKGALDSGMRYRKQTVAMGLPSLSEYEIWQTDEDEFRACAKIVHSFAGAGA